MKRISPVLLWLMASQAHAADIIPTSVVPIDRDPFFAIERDGEWQVGLTFEEMQDLGVDPRVDSVQPSRAIRRGLHVSYAITSRLELGLGIRHHQDTNPLSESPEDRMATKSRPLSTAYWGRLHLLRSESVRASVLVQYEPRSGDSTSLHQVAQDKTTVSLELDYSPTSWLRAGVYGLGSRREDERYLDLRIGDEICYGARLSLGPKALHVFGEFGQRELHIKKVLENSENAWRVKGQWIRAGLGTRWDAYELSASVFVPTTERYFGVPERGITIASSFRLGASPPTPRVETRTEKSSQWNGSQTAQAPAWTFPQADAPLRSKVPSGGAAPIESQDPDEFQLFEQTLQEENRKGQVETPQEKAERELRELREQEKLQEAQQQAEEAQRLKVEQAQKARKLQDEIKEDRSYEKEIDDELNQYTLPDSEELNWNGLQ